MKKHKKLNINEEDTNNLKKLKDFYGKSNKELSQLLPMDYLIKFDYIRK